MIHTARSSGAPSVTHDFIAPPPLGGSIKKDGENVHHEDVTGSRLSCRGPHVPMKLRVGVHLRTRTEARNILHAKLCIATHTVVIIN